MATADGSKRIEAADTDEVPAASGTSGATSRPKTAAEQRAAATAGSSDPDQLVESIEATREELAETIDAIADRVSPKRVTERTKAKVTDSVKDAAEVVKDKAADATEVVKEKAAGATEVAKDKAAGATEAVKDKAAGATEAVKDKAHTAAEQVKDKAGSDGGGAAVTPVAPTPVTAPVPAAPVLADPVPGAAAGALQPGALDPAPVGTAAVPPPYAGPPMQTHTMTVPSKELRAAGLGVAAVVVLYLLGRRRR